jgi:hypothetical protein
MISHTSSVPSTGSSTRRVGRAAASLATLALIGGAAVLAPSGAASAAPTSAPVAATVTPTSTASLGTIVFVKKGNVWIARGDGSGARKVTRNGTKGHPYRSPSESDAGVIAASKGTKIVRMTQHGHVLNRIDPPTLHNSVGGPMNGTPVDVAISPNGKTIAWSYVGYSCPIAADCTVRSTTGYTAASHYKRAGKPSYYRDPSWIGNGRTMLTGGFLSQVMLQDLHHTPRHWFDDYQYANPDTDLADGELSPNGKWLAEIRGYKSTSAIAWYQVSGNAKAGPPPAVPHWLCVTNGEAKHASPTWSPDSKRLAWAGKDGLWIKAAIDSCAVQPQLVIRGASAPDWSKAPLK